VMLDQRDGRPWERARRGPARSIFPQSSPLCQSCHPPTILPSPFRPSSSDPLDPYSRPRRAAILFSQQNRPLPVVRERGECSPPVASARCGSPALSCSSPTAFPPLLRASNAALSLSRHSLALQSRYRCPTPALDLAFEPASASAHAAQPWLTASAASRPKDT
jgi:hypothetical protein